MDLHGSANESPFRRDISTSRLRHHPRSNTDQADPQHERDDGLRVKREEWVNSAYLGLNSVERDFLCISVHWARVQNDRIAERTLV